ncbi:MULTISPECIES: hypothetical protein [Flavobacterium]|uniref:Uncharacterized protein n=1 Tax=Flavobacterium keumense TaxID=1306518 RepID=A0ABY8N217_9FLAO|nr:MULTISPECIES: hypothetical protein [Flavobacterium]WGK93577.1 hypothetical protein MG292_05615 [Flavobacterium keumense]
MNNDHDVYLYNIQNIKDGNFLLSINNDFGIALLYLYIINFFNLFGIYDVKLIAFIFNLITVCFIFINYIKVCDKLKLSGFTKFYFFLGLQILYFTQLINKDLLTLFFFILVLKWLLDKHYKLIIIFSILFFIVRIQLLIFGILTIYLSFGNFKKRIIFAYILTSIIGAITTIKGQFVSDETMGSGFSSFLIYFNQNYFYTGYLIFNLLRILQFFMDIYMSLYIYTDGLIDVSKILRIPLLLALVVFINPLIYSIRNFSIVNKTIIKHVYIILISFTLTWLMNPTINARYVMLIVPFLLILGRYIEINKKEFRAIDFNNKVL